MLLLHRLRYQESASLLFWRSFDTSMEHGSGTTCAPIRVRVQQGNSYGDALHLSGSEKQTFGAISRGSPEGPNVFGCRTGALAVDYFLWIHKWGTQAGLLLLEFTEL